MMTWLPEPENLELSGDDVHVWRASLEQPARRIESFRALLTEDERARADRFHFDKHRNHFIVARGVLRKTLGRYTGIDPKEIRFGYSSYGKPHLETEAAHSTPRFNLSHSHLLALLAVTRDREIGVDVEQVRADFATREIAERFFSAREVGVLSSLPIEIQVSAFFTCWTRKEAYIKAHGEGLSLPLDGFDVSLAPGEPAALLATRDDPAEASYWSLRELDPGPEYAGAVAVKGHGWQLRCFEWTGQE